MRILVVPQDNDILRTNSKQVEAIDSSTIRFLKILGETLKNQHKPDGVGLSGVQIGRPIRVFATLLPSGSDKQKPQLLYYINPEIIGHSKEKTLGEELTKSGEPFLEGCLSIPRIYGPVRRWPTITATALVLSENDLINPNNYSMHKLDKSANLKFNFKLADLAARVFQHEFDHLCGILFTDHTLAEGGDLYQENGNSLEQLNM